MSSNEVTAMIASLFVGGFLWGRWFVQLTTVQPPVAQPGRFWVVPSALGAFWFINLAILDTIAASDVRSDPVYVLFYLILGLGVSGIALSGFRLFGLRPADIAQRGNHAAAVFVVLAIVAVAFAYGGANVGEGPGFQVVLFCSALSCGGLLIVCALDFAGARTGYHVLVDRDRGAALRSGGMLIASGMGLGRAVAGNWTSANGALTDFARHGAPVLAFVAADVVVARTVFPRDPARSTLAGFAFAVVYIVLAAGYLRALGMPT
jgi:hypothetical protein